MLMQNANLNLGAHWEVFIQNEIASGRYASASEVICDALLHLEQLLSSKDRFEKVRGCATVKWRTDELMQLLRGDD